MGVAGRVIVWLYVQDPQLLLRIGHYKPLACACIKCGYSVKKKGYRQNLIEFRWVPCYLRQRCRVGVSAAAVARSAQV